MKIKYTWAEFGYGGVVELASDKQKEYYYYGSHSMPEFDTKEEAIAFLRKYCIDQRYVNEVDNYTLIEVYSFRHEVEEAIRMEEE